MKGRDFLEIRKEPGQTEVIFSSWVTGEDLIVFQGSPRQATEFKRLFSRELDQIIRLAQAP